jgi:outer membrane protein
MKKIQLFLICLFVLSLFVVPYRAFALGLEVGVGYWKQSPSGTLAYDNNSVPGTTLDIKNDLKYDSKWKPVVRVKAELPLFLPNLYFMATPMEFTGSGSKNFNFGGQPYVGAFNSKLKLDQYDLALYYSLPFLNTATLGILNAELGLDAKIIDFEATVTGSATVSKKLTLPIPMAYVGIQLKPVKAFNIEAEGRGISYGSNHFYDIIGRLKIKAFGPLYIAGGYRYESIKIDQSGVNADIKFSGPFAEAVLSF